MKGVVAGVVAGIIGAALWAIIAAVTGFEIGWLAWGIGAGVGAGVAWGSEGSPATGILAVIIAVVAILAGKFISVEIVIAKEMGVANEEIAQQFENDEYLISWLADEVINDYIDEGKNISWPAGVDPDEAAAESDYPPKIWAVAQQKWNAMSDEEKEQHKNDVAEQVRQNMQDYAESVKTDGFLASFGVIDIVFFVLAIGTAYKVGAREDYTS